MLIERHNFIIEYDNKIEYIKEVIEYLESEMKKILYFFELNKLSTKKKIIFYDDLELYKKHIEQYFEYKDYMCADTNDGNINILTLEAAHKTKTYSNITIEKLKHTILHEFVHICQQEKEKTHIDEDIIWFWEALATNLGNPEEYKVIEINANNEDIINFNCSSSNYPIAFTIGKYMLENYSHEEIIKYIEYPFELEKDSNEILNSARNWSKKIRTINQ